MKYFQFVVTPIVVIALLILLRVQHFRAVNAASNSTGDAFVRTPVLIGLFYV